MWDKTREERRETDIKYETLCELHGYPLALPGKAKYKISKAAEETKPQPDIEVGKKAVLSLNRGANRIGYYLAVLVDWSEAETAGGYWMYETDLFFIILERSNDKMPDLKGRIVAASVRNRWYRHRLCVNSWDISTFKKV
ncbi:MAG: hypothetical protein A2Z38_04090 [Planctomycetes bacterium RBG_19FT_COMBO_48_8]|nr:MAG: hypothetical protein A2Z38_04090 [Planctomycetes bacterium RBG_19FT_COMBO_48_8]